MNYTELNRYLDICQCGKSEKNVRGEDRIIGGARGWGQSRIARGILDLWGRDAKGREKWEDCEIKEKNASVGEEHICYSGVGCI